MSSIYSRIRKISIISLIILIFIGYIRPVKSLNQWIMRLDETVLKVGNTLVYNEDKPATIPNTSLGVSVEGENIIGESYQAVLLDNNNNKIVEKSGVVETDNMHIDLQIPGTTKDGRYTVKTTINDIEKSSEVVLLNNYNLNATITTDVQNYSGGTWDLVDGIHWGMFTPVNNIPTADKPATFIFDYGKIVDVYAFDLFSTYGNNQGPKTGEILYWEDSSNKWTNILNDGKKEWTFEWEKNEVCEPVNINFDKPYRTSKIMLKVTDSYVTWENTNNIVEVQVWAEEEQTAFEQNIDKDVIRVGYTDIYVDNKPNVPNAILGLEIRGNKILYQEYNTVLLDNNNNKIVEKSGVVETDNMHIDLQIPGTTKDGRYTVKTTINDIEKSSEVVLLNNYNLNATITTDVQNYSGGTWDLIDGIHWGMFTPVNNIPTADKPATFIFDYGKIVDVYAFDLFSTYGNNQGPKTGEILYWEDSSNKWTNILNDGKKEWTFEWEKNEVCEPVNINFDKPYRTSKIMLKVTDSYVTWENTNNIVEVQVWGHKVSDLPSITIGTRQGIYKQENIIPVVVENPNQLGNTKLELELVESSTHESLKTPIIYNTTMVNGKLTYDFVVPKTVPLGSYCIKVTYQDYEDYSDDYQIVHNQNINVEDCSKYFNIALIENDNLNTKLQVLNDNNFNTSWKKSGKFSLLFEVNPADNKFANVVLKTMKVYANKDSIKNVTLKYIAKTNYYHNVNVDENGMVTNMVEKLVPNWENDQNGDFFVIDPSYLSFGNIYILEVDTENVVEIKEIEIDGIYIKNNLFAESVVSHNGKEIDAEGMVDNFVSSFYKTNSKDDETYVFDFSPRTISTNEIIYTAHFPKSQGVKKMKVEIWDNNSWKEIGVYDFKNKTDNQIRESQQLLFENVTTEKIRLTVLEANRVWDDGSYLFTDINVLGKINTTAQYIANHLDTNIVVNQGDKKLVLPHIDGYDISLISSSNEDVVDLKGNIKSLIKDTKVIVQLKITNKKDTSDVGVTKEIEIVIPHAMKEGNKLISFEYDGTTIYNNPAMGWVQYYEFTDMPVDEYWQKMDKLYDQGLKTNILYIRNPWSWFESLEGDYAWKDPNSQLSQLIKGARERKIQLAFRVMVDSTDCFQQSTPEYVFDAGAKYYQTDRTDSTAPDLNMKDPYINDPIFLEKFDKFIKAFAKEFNDDMDIAYIDGMGFGNWGEGHSVKYHTDYDDNLYDAVEKIVNIYNKYFPDILLGTMEGQPERYGTNEFEGYKDSEPYVGAFEKEYDFVIRKDTFGWMTDSIRNRLLDYFNKGIPVFAENCYHTFQSRQYWYNGAGFPTLDSILKQVVNDALYTRSNTLDARIIGDCESWLKNDQENYEKGKGLLDLFALNCGYRFSPTSIEIPQVLKTGEEITVVHAWRNYALGILPNKNAHWDNKYQVSFALLDSQTNEVIYQYNESTDHVNPGDWLLENGNNFYNTSMIIPSYISSGEYKLAVAIVNARNDHQPELELAIANPNITNDGWYILDNVEVINDKDSEELSVIIAQTVNGTVNVNKTSVKKGDSLKITVVPNEGYVLDTLKINNQLYTVKNNQCIIHSVTEDIYIQASFKKIDNGTNQDGIQSDNPNNQGSSQEKRDALLTGDNTPIVYLGLSLGISALCIMKLKKKGIC